VTVIEVNIMRYRVTSKLN